MSFSEPRPLLFLEKTGSWVAGRKPLLNPEPHAGNRSGSAQRSSDLKEVPQHGQCLEAHKHNGINLNLRTGSER